MRLSLIQSLFLGLPLRPSLIYEGLSRVTKDIRPVKKPRTAAPHDSKVFRSEELLKGQRSLVIQHGGVTYRLIVTKNGKLILNK